MNAEAMRGVWLDQGGLRFRSDLPVPEPPPGEVRVRVRQAGICNTDLELVRGYYPFTGILGHEFVGTAGDGGGAKRRVCGDINAVCGDCDACRAGSKSHCYRRTVLGIVNRNGAMADYLCLPEANLYTVPENVSDDEAVFAEPLAAALQITHQVSLRPAERVVVLGDGKLGLLCAQVLARRGHRVLAVGRHPEKLGLLASRGIETALDAAQVGFRADLVVECTGHPDGFELARRMLRPRGTLVLKSTYAGRAAVDLAPIVVDEITILGSRCGPMDEALRLLAAGEIDVKPMIHARYPLAGALEAFEHAAGRGVLKVMLEIS